MRSIFPASYCSIPQSSVIQRYVSFVHVFALFHRLCSILPLIKRRHVLGLGTHPLSRDLNSFYIYCMCTAFVHVHLFPSFVHPTHPTSCRRFQTRQPPTSRCEPNFNVNCLSILSSHLSQPLISRYKPTFDVNRWCTLVLVRLSRYIFLPSRPPHVRNRIRNVSSVCAYLYQDIEKWDLKKF